MVEWVWRREIKTKQPEKGCDQPFGLAQRQGGKKPPAASAAVVIANAGVARLGPGRAWRVARPTHAAIAAFRETNTVRLPRLGRKAMSQGGPQFVTLCRCFGMW